MTLPFLLRETILSLSCIHILFLLYYLKRKEVTALKADCHIHMLLDGVYWKDAIARHADAPVDSYIHSILHRYQELGFTYLRDGGDRWGVGKRARELAPRYGITYRTPLAPLCKTGHYGGFIGVSSQSDKEFAQHVRQHRQNGADFIKIMISGLMDFDRFGVLSEEGMPPAEIRERIHIAQGEGFAVMAHCNGAQTAIAAAEAGVDSIDHGAYLNNEALCAMKENGVVWVPTLSTVANLRGKGRFDENAVCAILDSALQNVVEFAAMGGLLAPGTDAGAWAVPHGSLTEHEIFAVLFGQDTDAILERGTAVIQQKF